MDETAMSAHHCIVLAEDNEADVYLTRMALREHGLDHQIHVLRDGETALSFIDRMASDSELPPVALVLLDLHLPRRDGFELLQRLRSGTGSQIPVVVLTSSDSPDDRRVVEGFEKVHFFRKPASLDEFLRLGAVAGNLIRATAPIAAGGSRAAAAGDGKDIS